MWQKREGEAFARAQKIGNDHKAKLDQFTQMAGQTLRKHRREVDTAKTSHAHLKATYEKELQFKGPAKYWRRKRFWHVLAAALAFVAFTGIGVASGWTLWEYNAEILALSQLTEETAPTTGTKINSWQFGTLVMVTIPAVMLLWLLRLISRIFVMNLAGMSDAGHRATLISTFLALTKSADTDITPEERLLLIQGIFRAPGTAGDDAAPGTMLENLVKSMVERQRTG